MASPKNTPKSKPAAKKTTAKRATKKKASEGTTISISATLKDERFKKIMGLLAILFSVFLVLAFTSYIFTLSLIHI